MNYAKELLEYRARHDLRQWQVADKLGVTRETVNKIERGKQTVLSALLAKKIELLCKEKLNERSGTSNNC